MFKTKMEKEYDTLSEYIKISNDFVKLTKNYTYTEMEKIPFFGFKNIWAFFTPNDILSRKNTWENDKYVDLGLSFHGMGHYLILSKLKDSEDYFFRMDGGNNDYIREHHKEKFENFTPEKGKLFNLKDIKEFLKIKDIKEIPNHIFQDKNIYYQ